jgi:peptide-methionine (S)-S-oxide reductase
MEELFRKQIGVIDTEVGYMGGETDKPTYRNHVGHAEAIEITYDITQTNYKNILDYFFRIHNPTTIDKQGNDIGSSYRSAIFYQTEDEKKQAEAIIKIVDDSMQWTDLVVTKLEPFKKFWPAEDYHQDYLQKNKGGYTCHYERFGSFGV